MKNPRCEGVHCYAPDSEVRLLPTGSDPHHGNMILCRACFRYEIEFRNDQNQNLATDYWFAIPKWEDLKIYEEG